jgi:hypothetical protein
MADTLLQVDHDRAFMSETPPKAQGLTARAFNNVPFMIGWTVFLSLLYGTVGLPVQRALVVLWIRGSDAYFHHGIRELRGHPIRFSDGEPVPYLPHAVTGLAVGLVIFLGLSLLMMVVLRFYERHFGKRETDAA